MTVHIALAIICLKHWGGCRLSLSHPFYGHRNNGFKTPLNAKWCNRFINKISGSPHKMDYRLWKYTLFTERDGLE